MKKLLPAFFFFLLSSSTFSQSLDLTFSNDGFAANVITNNDDRIADFVIQTDGKIVVAGYSDNDGTSKDDITVARYLTDGTLDNTFDSDGIVTLDFSTSSYEKATAIALQTDGKIVIGGFTNSNGTTDFLVCRLNTDGSLDNSFDSDGIVLTDNVRLSSGTSDEGIADIVIQTDGKIIAAGTGYSGNLNEGFYDEFAVVRYNTNGSLDNTFSSDGKFTTGGNDTDEGKSVALQNDGKIVVTGTSLDGNTYIYQTALLRLNTDGSLDNTFDSDGKVFTNHAINNSGQKVIVESNDKIVVAGTYDGNLSLQRFNADGTPDNSFDTDGLTSSTKTSSSACATQQADNKFLIAGQSPGINNEITIVRFNNDGTVDNTFDSDGNYSLGFGYIQMANAITIDDNDNVLVAGSLQNVSPPTNMDFMITRLTGIITSVNEPELANVSVFPNPTAGEVNVQLDNTNGIAVALSVTNALGLSVGEKVYSSDQTITLNIEGPQGIYILNISRNGENKKMKIAKN